MAIKVTGFKIGNAEIAVEGAEDCTIRQACEALGIKIEGQTFVINGSRATGPDARVKDGSTLEILAKPEAGQ